MRAVSAVALLVAGAQGWDETCLAACKPQAGGPAYPAGALCPSAAKATNTKGYIVSTTATSSTDCPGSCEKIADGIDCENAAKWLHLAMDGNPGNCPSDADLVGPNGVWKHTMIFSPTDYVDYLGGCSWKDGELYFNRGNPFNTVDPFAAIPLTASDTNMLICRCPTALPDYVPVVYGKLCPHVDRNLAAGVAQTCGPLTQESECLAAAGALNYVGNTVNVDGAGTHLDGCHYATNSLRFNHALTGEGAASPTDKLICGCGEVAANANYGRPYPRCNSVEQKSAACGVGQTCSPTGLTDFECSCKYSTESATNSPAVCTEAIPTKYIQWITGESCPWSADVQCMSPPTKERCEEAAMRLSLYDQTASLPHSAAQKDSATKGCHYVVGGADKLFWNPMGAGQPASSNDYHICECSKYPIYVPRLSGGQCTQGQYPCKTVKSGFECGLAADLTGVPAPTQAALATWNQSLCTINTASGAGSPYISCSHPDADCTEPGRVVRACDWTAGNAALIEPGTGENSLDGCYYHALTSYSGARLWFSADGDGTTTTQSSQTDFRLCDCAHEDEFAIIAPRLGFGVAVPGNCAGQTLDVMSPCPMGKECVEVDGVKHVRGDLYKCSVLSEQACYADSAICTWTPGSGSNGGTCDFASGIESDRSELQSYFSDCLEHCLLLYQCTAISFAPGPGGPAGLGGCDFFTNTISGGTGETEGNIKCFENTPFSTPVPPAPELTFGPIPSVFSTFQPPPAQPECPVGFSVSSGGASTSERRAFASSGLPGGNGTNSSNDGPCHCEIFSNESTPFVDVNHSYCGNVPQSWYGASHFTCPHCMETGSVINVTCPNQYEACELIINLYVCPGCSSSGAQAWHGMWPSGLSADGWTAAAKCSAAFCSDAGQHGFVGFHKQILGGDTEVLPEMETDPTMYFSIIVMEGRVCSSISDQTQCVDSPVCQWESTGGGVCIQDWCPRAGGPGKVGQGCGPCAPGTPSGECTTTATPPATTPPTDA